MIILFIFSTNRIFIVPFCTKSTANILISFHDHNLQDNVLKLVDYIKHNGDPTSNPTTQPIKQPTNDPTAQPTNIPSTHPSIHPTNDPTDIPTTNPTHKPTTNPTDNPTTHPSINPTSNPTYNPTINSTHIPTNDPTALRILVPQSLAYSELAGLPPVYGLYSSVMPLFIYALLSTSTKVAVGPVAPTSIMIASAVDSIISDPKNEQEYIQITLCITFISGIIFILLGLLKCGGIIVLLTTPVMTGFITSAACIIFIAQLRGLLGLEIASYPTFYETLTSAIKGIDTIHPWTALIGVVSLLLLLLPKIHLFKKFIPKWVSVSLPLLLIIIVTMLSYSLNFNTDLHVAIVGSEIESGFPPIYVPDLQFIWKNLFELVKASFIVTIVAYMGSIALAKGLDTKAKEIYQNKLEIYMKSECTRMRLYSDSVQPNDHAFEVDKDKLKPIELPPVILDANTEFIAYGISTLVGSFFNSLIVSASFSRSALNFEMEGHSQASSMVQGFICLLCLLFLLPLLSSLPQCVLAAVVASAVYRLIKNGIVEFKLLYKVSKIESVEFMTAFIAPLIIGLEMGIIVAMASSVILYLYNESRADIKELGQIKTFASSVQYVDIKTFTAATKISEEIVVIELRAKLSFINQQKLMDKLKECIKNKNKYVIISLAHSQSIDTTALRKLLQIFDEFKEIVICLSEVQKPVTDTLYRYSISLNEENILPQNVKIFVSTHDAVLYCKHLKIENTVSPSEYKCS